MTAAWTRATVRLNKRRDLDPHRGVPCVEPAELLSSRAGPTMEGDE